MSKIVQQILELILLTVFVMFVLMDVEMRFVFEVGVIYLAMVIRHSNDGDKT